MTKRSTTITKPEKTAAAPCYRCGGNGSYGHWGACFRCGGSGLDPSHKDWVFPASWTDDQIAEFHEAREERNRKARVRRREKQIAEHAAKRQANLDRFPELVPIHERYTTRFHEGNEADARFFGGFAGDILSKMANFDLSEKQVAAVVRAVEEHDAKLVAEEERIANTPPVTEGTFEVVGTIVSTKWQENQWGGSLKQLVELDNGQRLWGTKPTSLDEAQTGDRVVFTATVTPSTDDPTFGFYSRPRKAEIL